MVPSRGDQKSYVGIPPKRPPNVGPEKVEPRGTATAPQGGKPAKSTSKFLPGSETAPVKVTVTENSIVITSTDPEALDEIEKLLSYLPADPLASGNFKIFFLKHVPALTAKQVLDQILTGDTTAGGGTSTSSGLVGDVARGMLGGLGGSMVEGMLGSGSSGSVGSLLSGSAVIVPDNRLNALFVQASPTEMALIQQLLVHIDAQGMPENEVVRRPGMIPVFFTNADEIATILRETYKDRLIGGAGGGGQGQPNPREFLEALRGGNERGRGAQRRDADADKMTIGVDRRSNSLIVVAPQPLFEEVEELVAVLDQASEEPSNDVRHVITLRSVSPDALARALKAIGGDKVKTTTSATASTTTPSATTPPATTTPGTQPGFQPQQTMESPQERIQRFLQFREAMGGGRDGGGGGGGGDRVRAFGFPFGGGGFPGSGGPGGGGPGGGSRDGGGRDGGRSGPRR
jgi:hypothetical protein